ncbi:Rrf2 family transcriptional regulator OS=Streptomyces tendae OX=1932 GN=F3L20_14715 PE=4 SV=1 [Streptomyces tendae]
MRRGGLVVSQRGGNGGYRLAKPADSISIADVIRVVEGPLVSVRGVRPPELSYCRCRRVAAAAVDRAAVERAPDPGGHTPRRCGVVQLPAGVAALADAPKAWVNP